ncbi:MAG: HAD-IC family P-type ATPase [Desulfohalobiaceae bacterium]
MNSPANAGTLISPVHTCVPGRARFKVIGLKFNNQLTQALVLALRDASTIKSVRGNPNNGSLLVHFHPETAWSKIMDQIAQVLAEVKNRSFPFEIGSEPASGPTYHRTSTKRTLEFVESSLSHGITEEEAKRRLDIYGPNSLPLPKEKSGWAIFAEQFFSLPVALLGAAAGISLLTGGLLEAAVISGVVVANSIIGFATERQSEKAIASLQKLDPPPARVLRNDHKTSIPAADLVPGDILLLQPGTYVGADSRIIQAENLTVDESILTGESLPVEKVSKALAKKHLPVAERTNMAFMGTVVTGGHGWAVVVATGQDTEMGQLYWHLTQTERPRPPIERKLARTGDQLVGLWCGICGAVFLMGLIRGFTVWNMLGLSVSLAAAAVPEGLPAASTTTFALGIKRMRAQGIIIRQLEAVETLGSVQTVCFDKTGTITRNQMHVEEIFCGGRRIVHTENRLVEDTHQVQAWEDPALHQILTVGSLCSQVKINGQGEEKPELQGSPTENALVRLALEQGLDVQGLRTEHALIQVNHRSQKIQIMSTLHAAPQGGYLHALKGSPLEVLELCQEQFTDGQVSPLRQADMEAIRAENASMAQKGYRVLGFATRAVTSTRDMSKKNGFVWLGLVGMADPLREGVAEVVQAFHRAGIATVMITGDQRLTAETVARQINLSGQKPLQIMDAAEMEALSDEEFSRRAAGVHVFARVSPAHKLKIVQALQSQGRIVAMTGDGINDGPALKAADVGIAMADGGADVARDVADVILEYDHLDSMIQAIIEGRTTYTNIKKSVHFFLSTNFSETMLMSGAIAAGVGSPLTSMQLLWINLISDIFPGLSLSMEPQDPDVLNQPPRDPQAPLFSTGDYLRMARESGVITVNAMGAYTFGLLKYGPGLHAGALAFHSLTLSQLLHAYSCRSQSRLGSRPKKSNPWLHAAVGGSIGLHMLTMIVPGLRTFLNLTPLRLADLGVIAGSTLASLGLNEVLKGQDKGRSAAVQLHKTTSGDYYFSAPVDGTQSQTSPSFFNHRPLQSSIISSSGAH